MDGATPETESGETASASPRRRLSTWRRVGVVASCLLIIAGLVILVDHAVNPSLPGQPVSGSITESKVQLIEQQLTEADILNNNGEAVQALQLYDKVLSEDPSDPNALAASGWLEWNYGTAAKLDPIRQVGRQKEKKAIRLAPSYYAGHLFLGLIILNQDHNPTGAIAEFTKFLADDPPQAQLVSVASLVASGYEPGQSASPADAWRRRSLQRWRRGRRRRRQPQPRSAAQGGDHVAEGRAERGDVRVGRRPADRDAERVVLVDAHRGQDG